MRDALDSLLVFEKKSFSHLTCNNRLIYLYEYLNYVFIGSQSIKCIPIGGSLIISRLSERLILYVFVSFTFVTFFDVKSLDVE